MKPDERLWQENRELRVQLDDARRWAKAWKCGFSEYRQAIGEWRHQYNAQQQRACNAEAKARGLYAQVEALFQENQRLQAEIERLKEQCRDIALRIAAELKNCGINTEGSLAAERIAKEIMGEDNSDG